ncbi:MULTISPECIES: SDR family NAD(P)-dependent oxidoreductase [Burkholderia]|uniref:SDR family NAD(P)-dependent oxidoreductase n=1 Tax=Burkholderia humptydooensis TaxID=430531 RepID=A0A7U4P896_9BURK|nr:MULTISPECIES: SDR family NAD(P)-dependent oxidoreductase [Burkholderia]AJY39990.1 short chain dehydrogenase family protein [Burkholderia sp. 2002721687]ALX44808.1 short-chain dehydrogenase [Burkholderia humptydooensis]KVN06763.1 short-chain dehydrogenase [Burkholderia sp. MSMB1552]KWZ50015.1 short-chain dehydrogenase [Burkholderia sp. MSMB1588]QPS46257.1 SDR family NAD(P)-dependent oxidoreductase [Burkholderia humptydooensis]
MTDRICLITGVGSATGSSIARRFARDGYRVAMLARNRERLLDFERTIEGSRAFVCDVGDLDALATTVEAVRNEFGRPSVVVHNAVSETFATFLEADPARLERNFRVNTTALLHLARACAPGMIEAGGGAIIVTGNTASLRGKPNYALFAPTKAAQRILAEALARELGPQRVHVGYVIIDAAIDAPWLGEDGRTRPAWVEPPKGWPFARDEYFAHPDAIADEVFHIAHQHPSTWSFDHVIRPFAEKW